MPRPPDALRRFSQGERWIHFSLATLFGICMLTAAMLYFATLSTLVGHRDLVARIHFITGLLLPLPLLLGAFVSQPFREDVRRLNRFVPDDWNWLRSRDRRTGRIPVGKFNAGQKLNSAFVAGAVLILFGTGLMLHFFGFFTDTVRTGATFVHDMQAAAVAVVAAGHMWMAWMDPGARGGLRTGFVDRRWADAEHGAWAAEIAPAPEER